MASTYTPLGVELMATGENAGTWGTKTNTNLNIIEQISGGYLELSIAGSAGTQDVDKTDGGTGAQIIQNADKTGLNVESSYAHSTSLGIFKSASTSSTGATLYVHGASTTGGTKILHVANTTHDLFNTYANGSIHCTGPILSDNGTDTVNCRLPVRDTGGSVVNTT